MNLDDYLSFYDEISVSSAAGTITSSTNDDVVGFTNFEIENLLEEINLILEKLKPNFMMTNLGLGQKILPIPDLV